MRDCLTIGQFLAALDPNPEPQPYGLAANWRPNHEIISKQRELSGTEKCRTRLSGLKLT